MWLVFLLFLCGFLDFFADDVSLIVSAVSSLLASRDHKRNKTSLLCSFEYRAVEILLKRGFVCSETGTELSHWSVALNLMHILRALTSVALFNVGEMAGVNSPGHNCLHDTAWRSWSVRSRSSVVR